MTDKETADAVEALAHRIRNRDAQPEPDADAEVFALEFMTALRGRGWRPTEARRSKPWTTDKAEGDSPQPQPGRPGGTEYLEFRRKLDDLNAAKQAAREDGAA